MSATNIATIEWYAGNGQLGLSWPVELMPGRDIDPIVWKHGGNARGIRARTAIRKLDFSNAADVKESVFKFGDAGDFGGAPPEVLMEILRTVTAKIERFETELHLSVPAADPANAKTERRADELVINVKEDGSVVWNGKSLTLEELTAQLTEIAKLDKKRAIIIRGTNATSYEKIVAVLSATRMAGLHHVSFATTTEAPAAANNPAPKAPETATDKLPNAGPAGAVRVELLPNGSFLFDGAACDEETFKTKLAAIAKVDPNRARGS